MIGEKEAWAPRNVGNILHASHDHQESSPPLMSDPIGSRSTYRSTGKGGKQQPKRPTRRHHELMPRRARVPLSTLCPWRGGASRSGIERR
ncbi:hypothetical protein LY78DRAFT_148166 [Colletotrichum sublineola]|nr:hypothetical protein LY78DRAFT_148166 [Colletotrichum sublineola]